MKIQLYKESHDYFYQIKFICNLFFKVISYKILWFYFLKLGIY